MEDACFVCLSKLFQTLAPLHEQYFCLFDVFSLVSTKSVFLRSWDERCEFLVKRLIKYRGVE